MLSLIGFQLIDEVLEIIKEHTKNIPNQQRLLQAIRMLCHPDPRKRGHI